MADLVSATRRVKIDIGGRSYTDEIISGSLSHDSSYTSSIITVKGQIVLGNGVEVDLYGKKFTPGLPVKIYADYGRQRYYKIPMGWLYVLSSYADPGTKTTILDVGCSLAFTQTRENIFPNAAKTLIRNHISSEVRDAFEIDDFNYGTLDSLLKVEGKVVYQTNEGQIKSVKAFSRGDQTKFTSIDKDTAISLDSLGGSIEDTPKLLKFDQEFTISLEKGEVRKEGTQVSIFPAQLYYLEGNDGSSRQAKFYVKRSGILSITSTVEWEITGGTVDEDDILNYNTLGNTLTFAAGSNYVEFTVTIVGDNDVEPHETLTIGLTNPSQGTSVGVSSATIKILNDDVEEDDDDDDDDVSNLNQEPFITSQLNRLIKIPRLNGQTASIKNIETGEAAVEGVPSCGTFENPGNPTAPEYAYTCTGSLYVGEKEQPEDVISGQYISYLGVGNQVDREITWEWCSAMTYAGGLFSTILNKYASVFENEKQRANALLSKVNNYTQLHDDYASRDLTGKSASEKRQIQNAIKYYGCAADQLYNAAQGIKTGANNVWNAGINFIDKYEHIYGMSNKQITLNTYNEDGTITRKEVYKYIHAASTRAAEKKVNAITALYLSSSVQAPLGDFEATPYAFVYAYGLDFSPLGDPVEEGDSFPPPDDGENVESFPKLLSGCDVPTQSQFEDANTYGIALNNFNQVLASKTVTDYEYGDLYNTETETFTDFEDPSNNYKKISRSSNNAAAEEDRITLDETLDGNPGENPDEPENPFDLTIEVEKPVEINEVVDSETETITIGDVSAVAPVEVEKVFDPDAWFGPPTPTVKTVSMPFSFKGFEKHKVMSATSTGYFYKEIVISGSSAISKYNSIAQRYLTNEAKRIAADRSGIRITEALRPELADYYPYYRVKVDLTNTSGKSFVGVSSVCNVVFDSTNVLVSLDLMGIGSTTGKATKTPVVATIPNKLSRFTLTEGNKTLDANYFNLPENTDELTVQDLPTSGTISLNGVAVNIGDTITSADIASNNIVYTPTNSTDTFPIDIGFTATKTNNDEFDLLTDLFPRYATIFTEFDTVDGGNFDDGTTNEGNDVDAGVFDDGGYGGGTPVDAGNLDTGEAVQLGPNLSVTDYLAHIAADPINDLGTTLKDESETTITVSTLPKPEGIQRDVLIENIDFRIVSLVVPRITVEEVPQRTFDYGGFQRSLGPELDFGTIANPNSFNADFGTIENPLTPRFSSGVV